MRKLFFLLSFLSVSIVQAAPTKVTFKTRDGNSLHAIYQQPVPGNPTVILLHGLASAKEEWNPLISALARKGLGSFAYDMRAPGTPWATLVNDVGAALTFLEEKEKVDRKTIVLGGASLGANVALKYAALTGNGKSVLLLSPGLNYQGLSSEDVVGKVKAPILIVASPVDVYAYHSSMQLAALNKKATFLQSKKPGHGVQMFDDVLLKRIVEWAGK